MVIDVIEAFEVVDFWVSISVVDFEAVAGSEVEWTDLGR